MTNAEDLIKRISDLIRKEVNAHQVVLFTTDDGVNVIDGERVLFYVSQFKIRERKAKNMAHLGNKRFYTREAAEEYVLMNKPLLSMNDIKSIDLDIDIQTDSHLLPGDCDVVLFRPESLLELAKSKHR